MCFKEVYSIFIGLLSINKMRRPKPVTHLMCTVRPFTVCNGPKEQKDEL